MEGGINTYAYVAGNPVTYSDPLGLWSISANLYWHAGGGVSFGQDPNNSWWLTWRLGWGYGGGFGLDPDGTSPAYDPCYTTGDGEGSFGVFAQGEASVIATAGAEAHAGLAPEYGPEISPGVYEPTWYANASWTDGVSLKPRLGALVAAGIERGYYWDPSHSASGQCGCTE